MEIYNKDINIIKDYIKQGTVNKGTTIKKLACDKTWEVTQKESLVLRSDMAYELGGGEHEAVSLLAFTTDKECVADDGVYLIGDDLQDITEDISYARLTFIRLNAVSIDGKDADSMYAVLRAVDYVRYHNYLKGYMTRISAVKEREPVRVSQDALDKGMTFAHIGSEMIQAYKKREEVAAVQIIFITDQKADYQWFRNESHRCEQITDSLNNIFNGLVMDCSTCGSRKLCDEIDGMKELHSGINKSK